MKNRLIVMTLVLVSAGLARGSLVLHYDCDEGSGSVAKSSVNQSADTDLTLTDATWGAGVSGGAIAVAAGTGEARAGNTASWAVSGDFSAALWFNLSDASFMASKPALLGAMDLVSSNYNHQYQLRLKKSGSLPLLNVFDEDGDKLTVTAPAEYAVELNTWTHLAVTFDYATATGYLYVNGVQVGSSDVWAGGNTQFDGYNDPAALTDSGAAYGKAASNGKGSAFGLYDEVCLYDEVLDDAAIAELAVPEPTTLAILALGGVIGLTRKKRRN